MPHLSLRLFGPFSASYGGEPLGRFRTLKSQALLIYLIAEPTAAHRREAVMDLLWPDLPLESAQVNLRQSIYQLRKTIPQVASQHGGLTSLVLSERHTIQISPDALLDVDALAFDTLVTGVRRHDHTGVAECHLCRSRLEQAAALYRGVFLADFYLEDSNEFENWAQGRRSKFRAQAAETLATLAESHLRDGNYSAAEQHARRQLELDNFDERAYRQLMEALAHDGRRNEAIETYGIARRVLREELGMAPSAKTAQLAERIEANKLIPTLEPARALPPIRGYKLLEEIGVGTVGRVYRAFQPVIGREVAVKAILPRYANLPDFIRRFEAEAQTVARLEHPHIVPLYDYWREPDNAYLVMRWLRGGSLAARLSGGPLLPDEVATIIDQIAAALGAAHRKGIIHHDVKPANILLDEDRNAYLSDFSLARSTNATELLSESSAPAAISPEQLLLEDVTPLSDQYALAAVTYELLTGQPAFAPDAPPDVLRRRILAEPLPPAARAGSGLPARVDDVLQRATAKRPGERFPDVESFARAFRLALNGVSGFSQPAVAANLARTTAGENPYKGLRAFEESDATSFFGREALVKRLLDRLAEGDNSPSGRFLAVVGPSGSGKSSVVKAGLLSAVRRGALPGSDNWFITEMTPGLNPLEELAVALRRVAVDPPADLLEPLRHDDRGLVRVLGRILPQDGDASPQLLLVIDQFEELFTLTEDDTARRRLIAAMLASLTEPDSRLRVVITLRADFYDRPLDVPGLGEMLRDRTVVILPMSRPELESAISRPADSAGIGLESRLLSVMMSDAFSQPGSLPLLQYALTELFERRQAGQMTLAAYEDLGGIAGALGRRADDIWQNMRPADQETTRQMFLRLVTLGEGVEDTRRRALRAELEALIPRDDEPQSNDDRLRGAADGRPSVDAPLDAYGRARLLTFDRDPITRGPTVEVAHEALLREWPRLRNWLDESRAEVRLQRLLAGEATEWLAAGRGDGYLLRGSRLDQFEEWLNAPKVALTPDELAFLSASFAARNQRRADEEARRRRELDTARQLAETERRRAEEQSGANARLRRRATWLAGALALAGLLAVAAVLFAQSSARNAAIAATRAAESNANAALAVENANLASARQVEAVVEAQQRATAEAEANTQRDTALVREREAIESYSLSLAANARQALTANDQPLALLLALAANTVEDPPLDAWRTLLDVAYAPGESSRIEVGSQVLAVDISPDGQAMVTGTQDGHVRLWDTRSGALLFDLEGHTDAVNAVAISPDSRQALSGSADKTVILWDMTSGEQIRSFTGHGDGVSAVSFITDGRRALSGDDSGTLPGELIVWDLASGAEVRRFGGDRAEEVEGVLSLATSPDARLAVVGYARRLPSQDEDSVAVWDIETGELVQYLQGTERAVNSIAISPDGKLALGASDDASIYVWSLETGALLQRLAGHEGIASAVAVSPDGTTALSGAFNGAMIWWDLRTGAIIERFSGHTQTARGIRFLDDTHAASVSIDETIRLWDLTSRWQVGRWGQPDDVAYCTADFQGGFRKVSSKMGQPVDDPGSCVTDLEISPDGRYVLSASIESTGDNTLTLFDYDTGQVIRRITGIEAPVREIEFTPDSARALTGHDDQTILLWDLQNGEVISRLQGHNGAVTGIDITDDGRFAVSASLDAQVGYWDLSTGKLLRRMTGYSRARGASDAQFLPGERLAISAGWDGTLTIWDVATGEQVRRLTGLEGLVGSHLQDVDFDTVTFEVRISPDGRYAISSGDDESVLLWDLASGQSIRRFSGHGDNVTSVRFTPNGQWALSGARNDKLFLWDVTSGQLVRQFATRRSTDGGFTPAIAIHPDGTSALTDDADGTLLKWQLAEPTPTELINWLVANRSFRELTCLERETFRIEPLCQDGAPVTSTEEMLAVARRTTAELASDLQPADVPTEVMVLEETSPERPPKVAQIGDNRGELSRHGFDVWTYEGKADEVLSIQMIADHPLTDQTVPVDERFESGVLDTVLYVVRPNGALLFRTDDDIAADGTQLSDANILATALPEDGVYRIEARSALDDHAGAYTLRIKPLERIWNEELFSEYVGVYLDGPWEYHLYVFMQDGRLYDYVQEGGYVEEYFPISETEFVLPDGIFERFTRDETGKVDGYDVYISLIHPVGGRWYRGTRIGDLPDDFYETLENVLRDDSGP